LKVDTLENKVMDEIETLPYLPRLNWVQTVRDPIWGEIPITEVERKIIQTTAFQRLRGIKQLGFSYLGYPSATHTRFEHSLGVAHTTDMLLKMVRKDDNQPVRVSSMARQILRLAALLHDVGHPPFSHAMENLFTYYPDVVDRFYQDLPDSFRMFLETRKIDRSQIHKHEVFTEYIICTDKGIRQVLLTWLRETLAETHSSDEIERSANSMIDDVISQLAFGKEVPPEKLPGNVAPLISLFRSIMNGDIDADKIDYLMRDNYYCGLPHSQDIDSLRDQLVLDQDGLKIHRGALKFVHTLLLARYRLISEVHQEKWDIFATAKVIELLHDVLMHERTPGQFILDLFTNWNDYKLLDYLTENAPDPIFQQILTTQYPLADLVHLDYLETHPNIRACIDILSDPAVNHHIPILQDELRELSGNRHLVVHVQKVKLPEFSMQLFGGGDLLGDAILRGISEESVSALQLIVYGNGEAGIDLEGVKETGSDLMPCEACQLAPQCIGNLETPQKKLLSEMVVHRYRKIVEECETDRVVVIDFLMLIMDRVTELYKQDDFAQYPIREDLYEIAKRLYASVSDRIKILGTLNLSSDTMTSSFHQQLRKYEQLGLIAYSRDIQRLESQDQSGSQVFRFDRRFHLSTYGLMWLGKIQSCFTRMIKEYNAYQQTWDELIAALRQHDDFITEVLHKATVHEPPLKKNNRNG
jgi:HD superfamily phosphohydrolase